MDDHKTVSVSRVYVPNEYVLYLSPKDREQFRGYEHSLLEELAGYLAEHARREGYALVSAPRVRLEEDADLSVGEFGIATHLAPPRAQEPAVPAPPATAARPLAPPPPPAALPLAPPADAGGTRVFPPELAGPAGTRSADDLAQSRAALVLDSTRHELGGRTLTIGRSKECEIVLGDPSASRRHAEVRLEAGDFWLVDLGSTNGTEVNGKRVDRARLEPGDTITIGQTQLRFER